MSAEKKHSSTAASKQQRTAAETPEQGAVEAGTAQQEPTGEETREVTTDQEVAELKNELDKAKAQAAENFEGWQRERADFLNYKKRIERDQAQSMQSITGNVIKRYLVVLDDLDRALKNRPKNGDDAAWAEGIELIYRKLQSILEGEGVQPIPAENAQFDPNLHEAITHEDSPDHDSGQVIEVLQQGYLLGDRVLRPARVRVAR